MLISYGNWEYEKENFECNLLINLYLEFSTTRLLAQRLEVFHNKIARKLKNMGY
ncbi:TyrR/PhhR family helix-turn-helix DNA-binding protein [Colwellia sp. RE-S-Sl-9]